MARVVTINEPSILSAAFQVAGMVFAYGFPVQAVAGDLEVVPIVRTGFSGFLACLFPYQAAFKSPSRYQVSGVLPSRLLWGRAWL